MGRRPRRAKKRFPSRAGSAKKPARAGSAKKAAGSAKKPPWQGENDIKGLTHNENDASAPLQLTL